MSEEKLIYNLDGGRMPYSVEAEQAVLGSVLVDPNCLSDIAVSMKADYFYIPQHKEIYKAMASMYELSQTIDFVSLLEALKKSGVYDEAGGKAYLTQLVQTVPSAANVLTYVAIIRERYYARSLMTAAQDIIKDVNENTKDSGKLLDSAEQRIFEIRQGREISGLTHIKDVILNETYDRLSKMADPETRNDYIGIPCGIGDLDKMITGLNKSDLIILGARPGMGKTSFALNIVRNVAVNTNKTVCFFSLEMTRDQLAQRMLSSEAGIKSEKLRTGELDDKEWARLAQAGATLSEANIFFDETSAITVPEMKAKLRRMKPAPDLVVIDYLGLMKSAKATENRVQEVSEITRNLKIMAKELKVPVIACAQLSRGTEAKGKSHKPALSDLRESGSIEQDADIVLFLYRETYYDSEKTDDEDRGDPNKAECIVAKNRHGEIGTVDLHWDGQFTRFTSVDVFR
ncbi:MAG: replicative DNA helicase [Clostridia bacterium]|nr:replicative DNA helicase [Oscillospiraceae bacterium]MBP3599570.1 replicative DNA helicase [Clostridia bacterium]MEE1074036.1 replicative DNA helicase [Acutalibacteraceae bacterium]